MWRTGHGPGRGESEAQVARRLGTSLRRERKLESQAARALRVAAAAGRCGQAPVPVSVSSGLLAAAPADVLQDLTRGTEGSPATQTGTSSPAAGQLSQPNAAGSRGSKSGTTPAITIQKSSLPTLPTAGSGFPWLLLLLAALVVGALMLVVSRRSMMVSYIGGGVERPEERPARLDWERPESRHPATRKRRRGSARRGRGRRRRSRSESSASSAQARGRPARTWCRFARRRRAVGRRGRGGRSRSRSESSASSAQLEEDRDGRRRFARRWRAAGRERGPAGRSESSAPSAQLEEDWHGRRRFARRGEQSAATGPRPPEQRPERVVGVVSPARGRPHGRRSGSPDAGEQSAAAGAAGGTATESGRRLRAARARKTDTPPATDSPDAADEAVAASPLEGLAGWVEAGEATRPTSLLDRGRQLEMQGRPEPVRWPRTVRRMPTGIRRVRAGWVVFWSGRGRSGCDRRVRPCGRTGATRRDRGALASCSPTTAVSPVRWMRSNVLTVAATP